MAITLAAIPAGNIWTQALVLAVVGIGITVAVYGVVALIVKADDLGVALARERAASVIGAMSRALGRGLVLGMPYLADVPQRRRHRRHDLGRRRHHRAWPRSLRLARDRRRRSITPRTPRRTRCPPIGGVVEWIVSAAGAGIVGLAIGAVLIPVTEFVVAPAWRFVKSAIRRTRAHGLRRRVALSGNCAPSASRRARCRRRLVLRPTPYP